MDDVIQHVDPIIRVRISHTHTLKDGWRCDSTTVEWTGSGNPEWVKLKELMAEAHKVGVAEAIERNNRPSPLMSTD